MVIFRGNRGRRADIAATQAFNTVTHFRYHSLLGIFVKGKAVGGTHIETQPATPAGLFMDCHFQHILVPPDSTKKFSVLAILNIQCHSTDRVGGTGQARIIAADNKLETVQHRLITALTEEIVCALFQ